MNTTNRIEIQTTVFLKNGTILAADWMLNHVPHTIDELIKDTLGETLKVFHIQALRKGDTIILIPPEEIMYMTTALREAKQ